ncbi:phospholipase D family protein [Patescibacteria group bacterium]|nr:phospholipase D family protein [Patescibacteria group bacterium]
MITHSTRNDIYIGRGAGKKLKEDLENASKSVKIVSPYLTPSYVEDLLKLVHRGVNVTLITSNDVEQGDGNYSSFRHTDLIKQKRSINTKEKELRKKGIKYSLLSFIIPLFLFYAKQYLYAFFGAMVLGFIFYYFYNRKIYSYSYYSPIRLKVVPDEYHDREKGKFLIHSKIYLIDEKIAYLGSINYTHKAFRYNYETAIKVTSSRAVNDISNEVERLFEDKELYEKDIDEWGRELYPEPRH